MKERRKRNWNPEDTIGLRAMSDSDMESAINFLGDRLCEFNKRLTKLEEIVTKLFEESYLNPENDPFAMPQDPGLKVCRYCNTVMGSEAKVCNTCGEPV